MAQLLKKLREFAELEFVRNGVNHDIYRVNGKNIPIPRVILGTLVCGIVVKILREAGLNMGIERFMQLRTEQPIRNYDVPVIS